MKILFLQKRLLFPTDTGGKIRTLNVVRWLARWHQVTYLCNLLEEEKDFIPAMQELGVELITLPWKETSRSSPKFYFELLANLASSDPYNVQKDFDPALKARAKSLLAKHQYDLLICDFVQMARNALGLNQVPKVLFQHNVEAEIFRRHAEGPGSWARRKYMGIQWQKMKSFEALAGREFDGVIAVSQRDKQIFEKEYGWNHVEPIDTAVDLDFLKPNPQATVPGHLAYIGSMDWLPNQDGVRHFLEQIWPRIRQEKPGSTFTIIGRNPPADLVMKHGQNGIEVTGTVPDVRPHLLKAQIVVVPLLVGGGTRIKIFEAMALGKTVVSTTLGAEGLPVTTGRDIVLADGPEAFTRSVLELMGNPAQCEQIGRAARELVEANYGAETVARQFDEICQRVVARKKSNMPIVAT